MRIVFDAYWWESGPPSLKRVLREIVTNWKILYPSDELILVARYRHRHKVSSVISGNVRIEYSRLRPQALLAINAVARIAKRYKADATITHNFTPRSPATTATFLHDVLFITNPEWFTRRERAYFSLMTTSVRHADVVYTSSKAESQRIRHNTKALAVVPVGLGVFTPLDRESIPHRATRGAEDFLLAVGRLNARKNLGRLMEAVVASGVLKPSFPLLVVGSKDGRYAETLSPRVADAIREGSISFLGFVTDAELSWLYTHTRLFIYLALDEGFGMPPLEAGAHGAPLLVSDRAVFRETLSRYAHFVDPTDLTAITRVLKTILALEDSYDARSGRQQAITARYSWPAVVTAMRNDLQNRVLGGD